MIVKNELIEAHFWCWRKLNTLIGLMDRIKYHFKLTIILTFIYNNSNTAFRRLKWGEHHLSQIVTHNWAILHCRIHSNRAHGLDQFLKIHRKNICRHGNQTVYYIPFFKKNNYENLCHLFFRLFFDFWTQCHNADLQLSFIFIINWNILYENGHD